MDDREYGLLYLHLSINQYFRMYIVANQRYTKDDPVWRVMAEIHHTGGGRLEGNEKIYIRLIVSCIRLF